MSRKDRRQHDWIKCRATGKRGYRSKARARAVLRQERVAEAKIKAVYRCPLCGMWHLTSQAQKPKGAK